MKRYPFLLAPFVAVVILAIGAFGIPSFADSVTADLVPRAFLPAVLKSANGVQPTATNTPPATSTAIATNTPVPTGTPTSSSIIIDHRQVDLFDQIPDRAIADASTLRMMFRHASVGINIDKGLNDLYTLNNKYNRSNWSFQYRANPGWQTKVDELLTETAQQASTKDVFTMKFCYIDPDASWTYYRDHMEQLMAAYPTKKFVWWTMPLTNGGYGPRDEFNNNVRAYAQTHNIILLDIAAIESHDPSGNPVRENGCEALYPPYSTDSSNPWEGHLGSAGGQKVAKAFWYMMAKVAGWQ